MVGSDSRGFRPVGFLIIIAIIAILMGLAHLFVSAQVTREPDTWLEDRELGEPGEPGEPYP